MPLSPKEIDALVEELSGFYGDAQCYPSPAQWQNLLACWEQGPVVMTNLIKLKESASNPYEPDERLTGQELLMRYQAVSSAALERVAATQRGAGLVQQTVIGPDNAWDVLGMVEYPTVAAFVRVFQDEDYRTGHRYREAAVSEHQLYLTLMV